MARKTTTAYGQVVVKALSYKLLSTAVVFGILLSFHIIKMEHAAGFAGLDALIRFIVYIIHEHLWVKLFH